MGKLFLFFIPVVFLIIYNNVLSGSSAGQDANINQHRVLKEISRLLEEKYVLPEVAGKYAAEFRQFYESGVYDSLINSKKFAEQVTADLIRITNDKHVYFRLIESSDIGEQTESALHHPVRYHRLGIKENKGFSKLEWLNGNIGYLELRRFYNYPDVKEMANFAVRFLSNADAIIIDIRDNGGGSGDYLSSYFLDHPTQLTGWYSRNEDFLTEFWTTKDIGVERLTDVPLFLLTSKRTFSAAESFAYDMKVRKRAILVGDSTKGGAHSVDLFKIDEQFEIYIPTVRAINPVTGGNWEGIGVIPDVIVPSESALDTAIVIATKAAAHFAQAKDVKLKVAIEQMQYHLEHAELLFKENKNADAGSALDSLFKIAYKFGFLNEFFVDVLAYNYQSKDDEQILFAVLNRKIEYFPDSPTAYESLAYACYKNNKYEAAISNFEKMLELDPDNRNAISMIKRLKLIE